VDLVSVNMHEPVCFERLKKFLFATKKLLPAIPAAMRDAFESYQSGPAVALGNLKRSVRRLIVANVDLHALTKEVLETSGDEPFFVPCCKDRDDSRGIPVPRSMRNVGLEIDQIPQSLVICFRMPCWPIN